MSVSSMSVTLSVYMCMCMYCAMVTLDEEPPFCLLGGSHSNINWYQFTLSRHKPLWSNKQGLYTCVCICVTICVTLCAYIMSVCLMYTLMMCSSHAFPHVAGHLQNDAEDVVCESLRTALQCHIPYTIPLSSVQYFWLLMSFMFLLWVSYGYLFLGIYVLSISTIDHFKRIHITTAALWWHLLALLVASANRGWLPCLWST